MNNFPARLRELRKNSRMTQDDLALKLGISKSAVSMYENGKREPDFETLEAISSCFGADMNYLLGSDNEGASPAPKKKMSKITLLTRKIEDMPSEDRILLESLLESTIETYLKNKRKG